MKKSSYSHLTVEERDQISVLKAEGLSFRSIASELGRHHTTISRELDRNAPPVRKGRYLSHKAHERSVQKKSQAHQRDRLKNEDIRRYVERGLSIFWAPEQISWSMPSKLKGQTISHEAIYQYIYKERPDLVEALTRHHRKRQNRGHSRKHHKSHIPNRISIEKRPKYIEKRIQAGHWERDSMVSRSSKACLDVKVERKSRKVLLDKLERKTAKAVRIVAITRLKRYPSHLRRSLTYDNGSEHAEHEKINKALGTKSYFCHPFSSWERGTNENTNGLIRRFLPKKTDFSKVSIKQIKRIEFLLNNRPRKCLNYKTPEEVFLMSGALKR
jgi:transposase, IS30 family